jgi:hypothetical protein
LECVLSDRDENFDLATEYFEMLGNYTFDDGQTVRESLELNGDVSIWDILATYLTIYRFPLLFNKKHNGIKGLLLSYFRLVKGVIGRAIDMVTTLISYNEVRNRSLLPELTKQDSRSILFLGFKDVYFRDILSTIQIELNKNDNIHTFTLNQKKNNTATSDNEYSIWKILTKEDMIFVRVLLQENNKLKKKLLNIKFINEVSNFKKLKINRNVLRSEMAWILYREIPRLAPFIALANRMINKNPPSLLMTADDADQKCRVFTLQARSKNIDTLVVQQGLVRKDYPEWVYFSGSKVACMGAHSKEIIHSQGVSKNKITLTGCIEMDRFFSKKIKGYKLFASQHSNKRPRVLFASQPYVFGAFMSKDARLKCISDIFSGLNKVTDVSDVLIKPHPNDNMYEIKKNHKIYRNFTFCKKDDSIADLIEECDIFVTMFSTSALQSMCAGKPVIIANIDNAVSYSEYNNSESVWAADTANEFEITLNSMVTSNISDYDLLKKNKARKEFISERCYATDGKSAYRVSELVLSMLKPN